MADAMEILKFLLFDENEITILITLCQLREMDSGYINWLRQKRITLQRIIRNKRIAMQGFIDTQPAQIRPRYIPIFSPKTSKMNVLCTYNFAPPFGHPLYVPTICMYSHL